MPEDFNSYHWAYTLGFEKACGATVFTPGLNGHKSLDAFDSRSLAHYRYGIAQGKRARKTLVDMPDMRAA